MSTEFLHEIRAQMIYSGGREITTSSTTAIYLELFLSIVVVTRSRRALSQGSLYHVQAEPGIVQMAVVMDQKEMEVSRSSELHPKNGS